MDGCLLGCEVDKKRRARPEKEEEEEGEREREKRKEKKKRKKKLADMKKKSVKDGRCAERGILRRACVHCVFLLCE